MKRKLPTKAEVIAALEDMLQREEREHSRCKHRLFLANQRIADLLAKSGLHKLSQTKQQTQ